MVLPELPTGSGLSFCLKSTDFVTGAQSDHPSDHRPDSLFSKQAVRFLLSNRPADLPASVCFPALAEWVVLNGLNPSFLFQESTLKFNLAYFPCLRQISLKMYGFTSFFISTKTFLEDFSQTDSDHFQFLGLLPIFLFSSCFFLGFLSGLSFSAFSIKKAEDIHILGFHHKFKWDKRLLRFLQPWIWLCSVLHQSWKHRIHRPEPGLVFRRLYHW